MLVEQAGGTWIEARKSWRCLCGTCGCVRIIGATSKYLAFEGLRYCVTCAEGCLRRRLEREAIDWPDHGFDGCCQGCDPTTDEHDCSSVDGGACCSSCEFRGGDCLVECVCGQPICTTRLSPGMTLRWDDRDVHSECYVVAVGHDLMTPGGDDA